ncbi:delta-60 repeat domain-containing protein [Desulfogranum marinum]|uniref:delta-60 repeat domain-containing protein n=1 Tax=Desulfogranum marinum TaxID=453220 RepID=UPI0029C832FB|nr:delta-60 repeat domain-containing protein [Desulfogranum marinum]
MRKKNILTWCILLVVFLLCIESSYGAYTLDTDFGDNGQVSESFGGISNKGFAVVVQPDGAIVVAGSKSSSADQDFSLIRYLADGSYDSSFNIDGRVVTSIGRADDEILAVGLLADGRIVAAGYSENDTDRDFALACYFPDGSLDPSFGDQGTVVMQIGRGHDEITALAVTPENQIVIAGVAEGTSGSVIVAGRFYDDGSLDASFGEEGVSLIGVGDAAVAEDVLIQESGKIIISGSYVENNVASLLLIRLTADGIIDATFGSEGVAVPTDDAEISEGYGITAAAEGRIYLAAAVENDNQLDAELFRFTIDGAPDLSFNSKGSTTIYAGPEDDVIYDVELLNEDKVVVTGYATQEGIRRFLVATYTTESDSPDSVAQSDSSLAEPVRISSLQVVSGQLIDEVEGDEDSQQIEVLDSFEQFVHEEQVTAEETETVMQGTTPAVHPVTSILHGLLDSVSSFFVGQAMAAESGTEDGSDDEDTVTVTILDSEEGDTSGNALSVLDSGEVVVVGTSTDQNDTDTLTVTQLSSTTESSETVSLASATSSYISTTPVTAITRTGALTGGRILSGLGTVTKKGVVFSIAPYPQYKSSVSSDDEDTLTVSITNPSSDDVITTESFTLSVTTSLSSMCGYNSGEDTVFESMTSFSSSYTTSHSVDLELENGDYIYYVRCQTSDEEDEGVSSVEFTVAVDTTTAMLEKILQTTGNFLVAEAVAADDDDSEEDSGGLFGGSSDGFDEEGETEDGSGTGTYSSILENLKPGTIFYARAYAIVGGTVYYGDEVTFRTDDSCFIATASYGSVFHPMVEILRDFRDSYLLQVEPGRKFVDFYYAVSPPVADLIASRAWMRFIVRLLLLPFVGFSWLALHTGIWQAVGISVVGVWLAGYGVVRTKSVLSMRVQQ